MDYFNLLKEFLSTPIVVALLTLVVSLYVSYKLTMQRERKLRAIERHSNDLRDLGKRWIGALPYIPLAKDLKITEQPLIEIRIEKEHLFSDIKNHISSDIDLFGVWEKFKKDLTEYDKKRFSLFQEILEDCTKRTKLPYNPDFTKGYGFSTFFVTDIYFDIFRVVEGNEPYHLRIQIEIRKSVKAYELWAHEYGLAQGSQEEMEKAKNVREEFLNELYTSKYVSKARDLVNYQESLKKTKEDFLTCLNNFISIPLYRGECKYVKWAL